MTLLTPTTAQIRAQVEAVLKQDAQVRALGIRSPGREDWPERMDCAGRSFGVVWCELSLAARQALAELDGQNGLVLLTHLGAEALGDDVLARLAKARLLTVEAWEMVLDIPGPQCRSPHLRQALDRRTAAGACPSWALSSGSRRSARRRYSVAASARPGPQPAVARPDADTLLRWSIGDGNLARFMNVPPGVQAGIAGWLNEVAGPVGGLVMSCVETGFGADALPFGLVPGWCSGMAGPAAT